MGDMADYYGESDMIECSLYDFGGTLQCRCCGEGGLTWAKTEHGWRLCNDEGVHVCPVKPAPEHRIRSSKDI